MSTFYNDIKFAFRQLRKNPGFTMVAVLSLALGIGATTAIVSVVKIAVFDPLPVSHSDQFLEIGHVDKKRGWSSGIYYSSLQELQQQTNLFTHVVAYHADELTLPGEDYPLSVPGMWVTTEFFQLWKLRPLLGRTFTADEGQPGKDDVLVISHRLWKGKFDGDPAIIGRTVYFSERPMTVVGVMPPHFTFPNAHYEYWRPIEDPGPATGKHGHILQYGPNLRVIAETQPGVTPIQVQAFLDVLTQRQELARLRKSSPLHARDLRKKFTAPEVSRTLILLLGIIVFVLLIAAANVANLQSARTETRQQELATRAALGAGRVRVFRQLLTESLLLAVFGGVAAVAVSTFGLDLLQKLIPPSLARLKPITLNMGVLGITSAVTLTTGLLFGLVPAWRGRRSNISEVMKLGATTGTPNRGRVRFSQALIVGQLALVLVLLAGAGLMVRSVIGLLRVNPGLDPKHIVYVYPSILEVQNRFYNSDPALNRESEAKFMFFADARQRIVAIPGVTAAGVKTWGKEVTASAVPGSPPTLLKRYWIGTEEANPLQVLRVPLKQGRWLRQSDVGEGIRSVLVNETAARRLWPDDTVLGKLFWVTERNTKLAYEVVGVVGDTHDLNDHVAPQPSFYGALQKEGAIQRAATYLVIRTAGDSIKLYKPIGQALKAAGADLRMPRFYNLHEHLWNRMAVHRALMLYLSIFAGVGLFLAAIGLYGILAYRVAQRTREMGIRMALGARITDVTGLVLRQGLALVAVGGVMGITVALALGRVLRAYLFGVSSTDPITLVAVGLLLAAVALLACWLPARAAARVNPMEALRCE